MNRTGSLLLGALLAALLASGCTPLKEMQAERVKDFRRSVATRTTAFTVAPGTRVDSVAIDDSSRVLTVSFSREFSMVPFRPENTRMLTEAVRSYFAEEFEGYAIALRTQNRPVEELIPNVYRTDPFAIDSTRLPRPGLARPGPLVQNMSRPLAIPDGLSSRNIVLWHSHGWYYDNGERRWMWQRPRLFQTVEDFVPMSFTLPYLVPMLENSGAAVFVPRERDLQPNEVIVDNDSVGSGYADRSSRADNPWRAGAGTGFRGVAVLEDRQNPFLSGTHRVLASDSAASASASWIPEFPDSGEYGVSVSYAASDSSVPDAQYTVFHLGGRTIFRVNQQLGGGTWVYLGAFRFARGRNPETGRVVLVNASARPGLTLSADAVRFGGGMGVVARNGSTSGRPKFAEGSRYFLQYAGMPDTLVYTVTAGRNDYTDDYVSRAEYANYLRGAPSGPNKDRTVKGLGIPVDLTLAFHTDAGIARGDTTIGTLSIFSTQGADSALTFPDSISRMASRDFADILQSQIVGDIHAAYDSTWRRRQLMDAPRYAEARLPNAPGALLELLSHQNFADMRFMLDPGFRFTVSRSIYKAMLRFLTFQYGTTAVVQPLPPDRFCSSFTADSALLLQWRPVDDPLEPTARPDGYIVYARVGDGGFDNGTPVAEPRYTVRSLRPGVIYSFRITAVNRGGESFPTEILSACRMANGKPTAMIVNGFDRISGPGWIDAPGFAGFLNFLDAGVADRTSFNFTGYQYDFDPASSFVTNDSPGHGASYADNEGNVIAGNSFDYPSLHGKALRSAGLSFVSASRDAVSDTMVSLRPYALVDLVLGKQKATRWPNARMDSARGLRYYAYPAPLRARLAEYAAGGGRIFVSGAYAGSEILAESRRDTNARAFARDVLKIRPAAAHAARTGRVHSVTDRFLPAGEWPAFHAEPTAEMYGVESVDALAPVGGSRVLLRYSENQFGAAVGARGEGGVVVFGFPFETIVGEPRREEVMKAVVQFLLGP